MVATGSGTISHYFNLHVVVPSAFILGSGEYHIGEGSTISLVCIIENRSHFVPVILLYRNNSFIDSRPSLVSHLISKGGLVALCYHCLVVYSVMSFSMLIDDVTSRLPPGSTSLN
uniref:Uncharacterized protein n=1 Tax=Timema tahoe TaxID=61484 RepID=A0A7R9NU01_9NEOP|nr:unnamed protein product [Timema tahoe]